MTDVSKLPKWAAQRIEWLEDQLDAAKAMLSNGPADSRVFANPYPYPGVSHPLGHHPRIRFLVARNPRSDTSTPDDQYYIEVSHTEEGHLWLVGSHSFVLRPQAANLIAIELRR